MHLGFIVYLAACEPFGPGAGDTGGVPPASSGRLLISPSRLEFSRSSVIEDAPETLEITARNTGGSTLVVAGLDRVMGDNSVFQTNAPALVELDPDAVLQVAVTFTPFSSGMYEGWLVPNGEEQVLFTGQATAPVASIQPSSLDLGAHAIGCHTQGQLLLSNTGDEPLTILSAAASEGFEISALASQDIAPQEQVELTVMSSPVTGGLYQGTVQVQTNDPYHPTVASNVTFLAFEGAGVQEDFLFSPDPNGLMSIELAQPPVESTLKVESNGQLLSAWTWDPPLNVLTVNGGLEGLDNGAPLTIQYLAAVDCSR